MRDGITYATEGDQAVAGYLPELLFKPMYRWYPPVCVSRCSSIRCSFSPCKHLQRFLPGGAVNPVIDLPLKCLQLPAKVFKRVETVIVDKMILQIAKRIFHLTLAPGMAGKGTARFYAVKTAKTQKAHVPLEIGDGCVINKYCGIICLEPLAYAAKFKETFLQGFKNIRLLYGNTGAVYPVSAVPA